MTNEKSRNLERIIHAKDFDSRMKEAQKNIVDSLGFKEYTSRDWGGIGKCIVSFPSLILAPFVYPPAFYEALLIWNEVTELQTFYKIKNKSLLKCKSNGVDPAIFVVNKRVFSSCCLDVESLYFNPNKIYDGDDVCLLFPPNKNSYDGFVEFQFLPSQVGKQDFGSLIHIPRNFIGVDKLYKSSKYFFSVEESVRTSMFDFIRRYSK